MRKAVSGGFNRLSSAAFGMSVRDLNCSFKLFRRRPHPRAAHRVERLLRGHRAGGAHPPRGLALRPAGRAPLPAHRRAVDGARERRAADAGLPHAHVVPAPRRAARPEGMSHGPAPRPGRVLLVLLLGLAAAYQVPSTHDPAGERPAVRRHLPRLRRPRVRVPLERRARRDRVPRSRARLAGAGRGPALRLAAARPAGAARDPDRGRAQRERSPVAGKRDGRPRHRHLRRLAVRPRGLHRLGDVPPGAGRSADPRRPRDRGPPAPAVLRHPRRPAGRAGHGRGRGAAAVPDPRSAPGPRRAPRSGPGSPPRWRSRVGYAFARPWTAAASQPLLFAVAAAAVAAHVVPRPVRVAARLAAAALAALRRGRACGSWTGGWRRCARRERSPWWRPIGRSPRVEIVLGSGGEVAVARGFGAYDAVPGVRYRRAPRGAELDLGDLGGGTRWTIAVTASHEGRARQVDLLRAGTARPDRRARPRPVDPALPRRAGAFRLAVGAGPDRSRRVRCAADRPRATIDRGRAWPSMRIGAAVLGAGLLAIVALGAAGVSAAVGLGRWRAGHGRLRAGDRVAPPWWRSRSRCRSWPSWPLGAAARGRAVRRRLRRSPSAGIPCCPPRPRAPRRPAASWPGWPPPRSRCTAAATSSSTPRSPRRSGRGASSSITCPIPAACSASRRSGATSSSPIPPSTRRWPRRWPRCRGRGSTWPRRRSSPCSSRR